MRNLNAWTFPARFCAGCWLREPGLEHLVITYRVPQKREKCPRF